MSAAETLRPAEAAAPPSGERVDRIASAEAQDTLDRIQAAAMLGTGAANMIGVDAIRRKLGDRWPSKRARVWEHVEMELDRRLGPSDLFVRVDELNYLIATPSAQGFAGSAFCLTILQDVLKFFLGEIRAGDLEVRMVTDVAGGVIASAPVDLAKLPRPGQADPVASPPKAFAAEQPAPGGALSDQPAQPKEWKPPLAGRISIIELALPKADPFDLKLTVEPVWNLKRGLIASFLIEREGAPANAQAAEYAAIDLATCAYAATLLEEQASQGGPLSLHVPISFSSLAMQHSRHQILSLTQSVREAMRASVLLEICGLDSGVPPSRLLEIVGLVRPLCAAVMARVRPSRSAIAAARGCGLRAAVVEAAHLAPQQEGGRGRMRAFVTAAQTISPNLIIHGLMNQAAIDEAAAAGFTHASVAAA